MIFKIMIVIGCAIFGYLLPELCFILGSRAGIKKVPWGQNFFCFLSFALISSGILFL
jgi:hypothetical protein